MKSSYKGVYFVPGGKRKRRWKTQIIITDFSDTEIKAALKYNELVKKFNLKKRLN